jgi:hypothetical protein
MFSNDLAGVGVLISACGAATLHHIGGSEHKASTGGLPPGPLYMAVD